MLTTIMMIAAMVVMDVVRDVRPAQAAGARVNVSVEGGTLNPTGKTVVDLSGSGFQSVQGGFGGIYVLFGWVNDPSGGSWRPSRGSVTGESYRYVPDDESNPAGYDVFVAFPGDTTASAANGGQIAANGTWSAKITVPGAKFTSYDRSNNPIAVDCTAVQCGIITIGAHGVTNAANETFTPLRFASQGNAAAGDGNSSGAASTSGGSSGAASASASAAAKAKQEAAKQQAAKAAAEKKAAEEAKQRAAEAANANDTAAAANTDDGSGNTMEGNDMSAQIPALGIAGWLIVAAIIIFGIAVIVLAAGVGGYLAAKSLLLGISPAALDKEIAKRERKAEAVRAREAVKTAKRRRRQYRRLVREQAKADRAQSLAEDSTVASDSTVVADSTLRGFFSRHDGGRDKSTEHDKGAQTGKGTENGKGEQ
ncbi:hypothetical protein [Bifidobacterium margollesii]|nr:hypothetical protein [Bifidobacterium margollesii]